MVVFSSVEFIFRFMPVFMIIYWIAPGAAKKYILFAGSILFYAVGSGWFTLLLLGATVFNFLLGNWIYMKPGRRLRQARAAQRKKYLRIAVGTDVFLLVLCKILALKVNAALLPLGMSFYIFKMISFQADIYTGKIEVRPGFINTAVYFSMFPQVTQGPIMRYGEGNFEQERRITLRAVEDGMVFFVIGLGMKVLLADRIGILWNELTKIGYESISTPLAWLGAYAYSFQLYFDFWGYSLMAGGLAMMLGFPLIRNFTHPYAASGVSDFYRRWHATLGSWFRDYVYIPLGGSREGAFKTIRNLLAVWLLTGFWHGGSLNFIIWGVVLGLIIIWEKYPARMLLERFPVLGHLHTIILIPLTWVIFAVTSLQELEIYFSRLFPFFSQGVAVWKGDIFKYLGIYWPYLLVSVVLCVPAAYNLVVLNRRHPAVIALLTGVFWWSVYMLVNNAGNTFMYFTF